MKILTLSLLLLSGGLSAQTTIIAHKSHSGTAASYAFAAPGNFGAPPPSIVYMKKISDTGVVVKYDRWGGNQMDTLYNHPLYSDPTISEDTMKVLMKNMDIEYEVAPVAAPVKTQSKEIHPSNENKERPVKKHKKEKPVKKSMLWLIVLGGGTFFGGMLLTAGKRRSVKPALIS